MNSINPNIIRLQAAREFVTAARKALLGVSIDAFVFGSVAREEARQNSDVDIVLCLEKRPSREEMESGNSYTNILSDLKTELEEKYQFPISVYPYYADGPINDPVGYYKDCVAPFLEKLSGTKTIKL